MFEYPQYFSDMGFQSVEFFSDVQFLSQQNEFLFQTLAQAGYIENTRTLSLQRVHVPNQVLHYLKAHGEGYVLGCMQVAS